MDLYLISTCWWRKKLERNSSLHGGEYLFVLSPIPSSLCRQPQPRIKAKKHVRRQESVCNVSWPHVSLDKGVFVKVNSDQNIYSSKTQRQVTLLAESGETHHERLLFHWVHFNYMSKVQGKDIIVKTFENRIAQRSTSKVVQENLTANVHSLTFCHHSICSISVNNFLSRDLSILLCYLLFSIQFMNHWGEWICWWIRDAWLNIK